MNEYAEVATLIFAFSALAFALLLIASSLPTVIKAQTCDRHINNTADYVNQETCRAQVAQNSTLLWGLLK